MTGARSITLWAPVVGFMALQFVLSSRSSLPGSTLVWDKAVHTAAYALLGLLSIRACNGGMGRLRPGPTLAAVALTLTYGLVDELHQATVPGRHASALDWVANAVGVGLALLFALIMQSRQPRTGSANGPAGGP